MYTLKPEDFHSIIPKLSIKVGTKVKAGEAVFYNKANEDMKFPSPVSGELIDIIRGEKRKILAIKWNWKSKLRWNLKVKFLNVL